MVDFAKHKQSLLCNDPQSIADYEKKYGNRNKCGRKLAQK